jgi:hypothetical protein
VISITAKTENLTDLDGEDSDSVLDSDSASMDDGISSGIGGRLLKFRKKTKKETDTQNDGGGELEFTEDAEPKQKFKRGA